MLLEIAIRRLNHVLPGVVLALLLLDTCFLMASPTVALAVDNRGQDHSPRIEQKLKNGHASIHAKSAGLDPGIDVSSAQHAGNAQIDWASVAGAGYTFAFIKATEGTYYINPYYSQDLVSAKASGLYVAAYHFATPDTTDGATQADYLLDSAQYTNDGRTFAPALDIEYNPYGSECYGLSPGQMVLWVQAFNSEILSRIGRVPFIYTTADWWNTCTGGSTAFAGDPLWVAAFSTTSPALPPGWSTWTFWQYTSTGSVPGISGNVDLSYFGGSAMDLAVLGGSAEPAFGKAVFDSTGDLYVMAEGPGNSLSATVRYASDGTWHGPFSIDGAGTTYATPSPVFDSTGNLFVMTEGPSNSLYGTVRASNGDWSGPFAIDGPGSVYAAPSSVFDSAGDLFVMTEGPGNSLYGTVRASNGDWSGPFAIDGPGSVYAAPSSVFDSAGDMFVMTEGPGNSLYGTVRASNGGWSGPYPIDGPGSVYAAPSSIFDSAGDLFVMTEGQGNSLYGTVRDSNGGWSGPYPIDGPGSVYAAPSSIFDSAGDLFVMTEGSGNTLSSTVRTTNGNWN
ncbi:MAG: hypothetical protein J2P57_03390, partial [Acidimicrobiaceae bacterium]|nr:hypothetical protein [Acidimicrobiaceae bacterium]